MPAAAPRGRDVGNHSSSEAFGAAKGSPGHSRAEAASPRAREGCAPDNGSARLAVAESEATARGNKTPIETSSLCKAGGESKKCKPAAAKPWCGYLLSEDAADGPGLGDDAAANGS